VPRGRWTNSVAKRGSPATDPEYARKKSTRPTCSAGRQHPRGHGLFQDEVCGAVLARHGLRNWADEVWISLAVGRAGKVSAKDDPEPKAAGGYGLLCAPGPGHERGWTRCGFRRRRDVSFGHPILDWCCQSSKRLTGGLFLIGTTPLASSVSGARYGSVTTTLQVTQRRRTASPGYRTCLPLARKVAPELIRHRSHLGPWQNAALEADA